MSEEQVTLKIPTARQKLKAVFPEDPKGDFRLVFKSKVFNLQKAHLRLESGYFKKVCSPNVNILEVKQNFDDQFFSNVMFCFYGASIVVDRGDLPSYYPIIYFLEIQSLLNFIRQDILASIDLYDLFVVMRISHTHTDQKLFEACLEQLEKESFEQLKYHQFELLQTDMPLFKLIIKSHNRYRSNGGNGIPFLEIDTILKEYCENKALGLDKYQQLKFELIDKNSLTSAEYKEIFLDEAIKMKTRASMIMEPTNHQSQVTGVTGLNKLVSHQLAQSVRGPVSSIGKIGYNSSNNFSSNMSNELTLEMENTFQKKKNEELKSQNKYLSSELETLRRMTQQNSEVNAQMEVQLKKLREELKKKETIEHDHKNKINAFETILKKMQRQMQEKSKTIDALAEQFEELKKRKPLSDDQDEADNNAFVQSTFLPAHLINEMMGGYKPAPKKVVNEEKKSEAPVSMQASIDEEELEQMYLARLKFDEEPISVPKVQLPKLVGFISGDDFNRKILTLIYRRSNSHPSKGQDGDLRNKENLLILISTATGQHIGGYISARLPTNSDDYVRDPGAFLFTLTKTQKFQIKKTEVEEAIFLSDHYLISFANDLMISNDCLNEESYCSWPSSYQPAKSVKERGSIWFAGANEFLIKDIEIYELSQEDMVMEL